MSIKFLNIFFHGLLCTYVVMKFNLNDHNEKNRDMYNLLECIAGIKYKKLKKMLIKSCWANSC